jgi:hypothetical protein
MRKILFFILFGLQYFIAVAQPARSNKEIISHFYTAFNERNFGPFYACFSDSVFVHLSNYRNIILTPEQIKSGIDAQLKAFPDIQDTIALSIGEGDWVSICVNHAGINSDSLRGLPPSNKYVNYNVMEMYKLSKGKIVEIYVVEDQLGMYQQMGIIPNPIRRALKPED